MEAGEPGASRNRTGRGSKLHGQPRSGVEKVVAKQQNAEQGSAASALVAVTGERREKRG